MATYTLYSKNSYDGRKLRLVCSSTMDIANNSSIINWTLYSEGGNSNYYSTGPTTVKINGEQVYYKGRVAYSSQTFPAAKGSVKGTLTVPHNSDGKKSITVSLSTAIYTSTVSINDGTWTLDNIPRQATISKATNFTDIQNPTITYSNPAGNNVTSLQACISLTGSRADIPYRDISKTGTSYTFNLTESERNVLRQACPDSKTLDVRFYVQTVINGTTYRKYETATMTIVNANPTFEVAYLDTNATTTAITNNNQQIIQNNSTLQINISNAAALKYASLVSASANVNGNVVSENFSSGSTSISLDIGTINVANNLTVPVTVTDTRGNKTIINLTVIVLAWSLPSAIISLERESNFYSETNINVNAEYSSLDGKNTITIQYQIKKVTDSTYGALQTLQDNVTSQFTADNNYSWNVKVILTDRIGSYTYDLLLYKGIPLVYFDKHLSSVGINCFPSNEYSFEVNGLKMFYSSGDIIQASNVQGSSYCLAVGGFITNSAKDLWFNIPLTKPTQCTSANVEVTIVARQGGNYIKGSSSAGVKYTLSNCQVTPAGVVVHTADNAALANAQNNDSVGIAIISYKITFN